MPAFDQTKVLDPNPAIRIANAYQAVLDYAAARLSAADFTTLQTNLTAVGLPTNSDDVLTLPNPALFLDGVMVMAMNFVTSGGREINPTTITTLSPTIQALRVIGNLAVNGGVTATGTATFQGELQVNQDLTVATDMAVGGNGTLTGSMAVTGGLGVGQAAPASGVSTPGAVQGNRLIMASGQDPTTASNGTLAEDATGDLFYKDIAGNVKYIARPQFDTGWINLSLPANYSTGGGFLGINNPNGPAGVGPATYAAANPALTPDIYGAGGLWAAGAGNIGDAGRIVRVEIWNLCDFNAFDEPNDPGGTLSGTNIVTPINSYSISAIGDSPNGVLVHLNETTGQLSITVGEAGMVPGFERTAVYPVAGASLTFLPQNNIRVMAWTR